MRLAGGNLQCDVGQTAAALVLLQEHVYQVGEFSRLFEAWEEEVLLQFLVIVLDEIANAPSISF